ncbi:uncharacterized protein PSFLO_04636 [Pseudozyma flocculosa]|uniref:Uncharacterized protein n=1 Tax=Pseudozyma flocculosa TaxID=84751 RepID=A0A5C3F672_9BASI|nr:uncharacterized protein PSFLO_04636 [Pseudozyma flocculosa]
MPRPCTAAPLRRLVQQARLEVGLPDGDGGQRAINLGSLSIASTTEAPVGLALDRSTCSPPAPLRRCLPVPPRSSQAVVAQHCNRGSAHQTHGGGARQRRDADILATFVGTFASACA